MHVLPRLGTARGGARTAPLCKALSADTQNIVGKERWRSASRTWAHSHCSMEIFILAPKSPNKLVNQHGSHGRGHTRSPCPPIHARHASIRPSSDMTQYPVGSAPPLQLHSRHDAQRRRAACITSWMAYPTAHRACPALQLPAGNPSCRRTPGAQPWLESSTVEKVAAMPKIRFAWLAALSLPLADNTNLSLPLPYFQILQPHLLALPALR